MLWLGFGKYKTSLKVRKFPALTVSSISQIWAGNYWDRRLSNSFTNVMRAAGMGGLFPEDTFGGHVALYSMQ